jgi:hypothetical protein
MGYLKGLLTHCRGNKIVLGSIVKMYLRSMKIMRLFKGVN